MVGAVKGSALSAHADENTATSNTLNYKAIVYALDAGKYCNGENFAQDAKVDAKFDNCKAMQNFYDDVYELLTLTNASSRGDNFKELNEQVTDLNSEYAKTGIRTREANLPDNYNFLKQNPNVGSTDIGQKTYDAYEKQLSIHLDLLFNYKSEEKLYADINNYYYNRYQIPLNEFTDKDTWFLDCDSKNTGDNDCIGKWAEYALTSENGVDFRKDGLSQEAVKVGAQNFAAQIEAVQDKISNAKIEITKQVGLIGDEGQALQLKADMSAPGFDIANLTDEQLAILDKVGEDTTAYENYRKQKRAGKNNISLANVFVDFAKDGSGHNITLSSAGQCSPTEDGPVQGQLTRNCLTAGENTNIDFGFNAVDSNNQKAVSEVVDNKDKTDSMDENERKLQQWQKSGNFKDLTFQSTFQPNFTPSYSDSSVGYQFTDQNSKTLYRNSAKNDYEITNGDFSSFKPTLRLHNNHVVCAKYKVYGYDINSDSNQVEEKKYADVNSKCIGSNLDVTFSLNTVAIKVQYEGEAVSAPEWKTVFLKPYYHQQLDVHNHSGVDPALDDAPTNVIEYGKDCDTNDCKAKIQLVDAPIVHIKNANSGIAQKTDLTFFDKDKKQVGGVYSKHLAAGQSDDYTAPVNAVYMSMKTYKMNLLFKYTEIDNGSADMFKLAAINNIKTTGTTIWNPKTTISADLPWAGSKLDDNKKAQEVKGVSLKLKGSLARVYAIYYRLKDENGSTSDWASNGKLVKTGKIAGLQIKLVAYQHGAKISAHQANGGWITKPVANPGDTVTIGEANENATPLNSISATLNGQDDQSHINYAASYINTGLSQGKDHASSGSSPFDYERGITGKKTYDNQCTFFAGFSAGRGFVPTDENKGLFTFSTLNQYTGYRYGDWDHQHGWEDNCKNSVNGDHSNTAAPEEKKTEFTIDGDVNGHPVLANLALKDGSNFKSGIDPKAVMTQVGFKLSGNVAADFSIKYQIFQKNAYTKQAGWSTWVSDGQLIGDGQTPIYAINYKLEANQSGSTPLASISGGTYINAGPYRGKEEVAYLDNTTWKYTTCDGSYVNEQGVINFSLKDNCKIADGTLVRFGVQKQGAIGAHSDGENAKDWSEPFITSYKSDKVFAYAVAGAVDANDKKNFMPIAYGKADDINKVIKDVVAKIKKNEISEAIGWTMLGITIAATISSFVASEGTAAGAIALAASMTALGLTIADTYYTFHGMANLDIQDISLPGKESSSQNYDDAHNRWFVSGFSWVGTNREWGADLNLYYKAPNSEDTKSINFGKGKEGDDQKPFIAPDGSKDGKSVDYAKQIAIPEGSEIWLGSNPDAKVDHFTYKHNTLKRAGYITKSYGGDKNFHLVAFDDMAIIQLVMGDIQKLATETNNSVIGQAVQAAFFLGLSVLDLGMSVHGVLGGARKAVAQEIASEGGGLHSGEHVPSTVHDEVLGINLSDEEIRNRRLQQEYEVASGVPDATSPETYKSNATLSTTVKTYQGSEYKASKGFRAHMDAKFKRHLTDQDYANILDGLAHPNGPNGQFAREAEIAAQGEFTYEGCRYPVNHDTFLTRTAFEVNMRRSIDEYPVTTSKPFVARHTCNSNRYNQVRGDGTIGSRRSAPYRMGSSLGIVRADFENRDLVEILVPSGANFSFSNASGELEAVFPEGTEYELISENRGMGGSRILRIRIISTPTLNPDVVKIPVRGLVRELPIYEHVEHFTSSYAPMRRANPEMLVDLREDARPMVGEQVERASVALTKSSSTAAKLARLAQIAGLVGATGSKLYNDVVVPLIKKDYEDALSLVLKIMLLHDSNRSDKMAVEGTLEYYTSDKIDLLQGVQVQHSTPEETRTSVKSDVNVNMLVALLRKLNNPDAGYNYFKDKNGKLLENAEVLKTRAFKQAIFIYLNMFGIHYTALPSELKSSLKDIVVNIDNADISTKLVQLLDQLLANSDTAYSVENVQKSGILSALSASKGSEINLHFGYADDVAVVAQGNVSQATPDNKEELGVQKGILDKTSGILINSELLTQEQRSGSKITTIGSAKFVWIPLTNGVLTYNKDTHTYSANDSVAGQNASSYHQLLDGSSYIHGLNSRSGDDFNSKFGGIDMTSFMKVL
jgi:hypothetical protein